MLSRTGPILKEKVASEEVERKYAREIRRNRNRERMQTVGVLAGGERVEAEVYVYVWICGGAARYIV